MKLKSKLILILLAGSLASVLLGGGMLVYGMQEFHIRTAAHNYKKQMDSLEYIFSESVLDKELGHMGELALEAYLKFQFRRCFGEGYALLKEEKPVVNLTDFEILDSASLNQDYALQHLGSQTILLLKQDLKEFPGYDVICVQDISFYYKQMREQVKAFGKTFAVILILTCAGVYLLLETVLKPLEKLTKAAMELGSGNLSARVEINGKDETGKLAGAFNTMADRVEKQVDELHLLLGALTHEIKTPMTSIIGYSDTLLRVKLSPQQQKKALQNINHAGKRLERLSSKMLTLLGAYETGEISLKSWKVKDLVQEMLSELEPVLKEKQIRVEVECSPDTEIMADRELMLSLLLNLMGNAIKASGPGSPIRICCTGEALTIEDEGCGIPAHAMPHVKEAFFMADKSRSRSEGGSGLGLALCDRIAALHGMDLELKSQEQKGTIAVLHFLFTKHLQSDEDSVEDGAYN